MWRLLSPAPVLASVALHFASSLFLHVGQHKASVCVELSVRMHISLLLLLFFFLRMTDSVVFVFGSLCVCEGFQTCWGCCVLPRLLCYSLVTYLLDVGCFCALTPSWSYSSSVQSMVRSLLG